MDELKQEILLMLVIRESLRYLDGLDILKGEGGVSEAKGREGKGFPVP